jgi:hypothetical protein
MIIFPRSPGLIAFLGVRLQRVFTPDSALRSTAPMWKQGLSATSNSASASGQDASWRRDIAAA